MRLSPIEPVPFLLVLRGGHDPGCRRRSTADSPSGPAIYRGVGPSIFRLDLASGVRNNDKERKVDTGS